MPTSLGRIEPTSTAPLDARLGPSADVLSELHVDLIREKRRSFLAALPLGVLAAAALVGASLYPRELGGLVFVALIVLAAVGRVGFEWLTLRRSDATALYRRERELDALRRDRQIEHEARLAEVAPIATSLLTAIIVLVTGVEFARIAAVPVTDILVRGALIKPAVRAGEWWRLLTATYLHGNLMHIAANASVLMTLGRIVETYSGRLRVPLAYVCGALCGSVVSVLLSDTTSLGASGGVIALAAYLLVIAGATPNGTPVWMRQRMLSILASTAVLGAAAFMFIDNGGHLGGAIGGALVGLLVRRFGGHTRALDLAGMAASLIIVAGAVMTIVRLLH